MEGALDTIEELLLIMNVDRDVIVVLIVDLLIFLKIEKLLGVDWLVVRGPWLDAILIK